ncbi:hypothetical protein [Parabacteroides johnsonii]|jgi:hypothetical protein|uniref:hypothetical protein n=1 Tax=Parabacteroides johnsonii TaxID=387661 RepID=UPI00206A049B|nr:hypothetical protein [Parabacteroides johnsonii]DAI59597.1 MAG TPA: hypothetical protein [Caudoviricetes sp.]
MAAGDINIDGIQISPEGLARLVAAVTQNIEAKSNDPGQIEVIDSLNGVTSIPVLQQIGSTVKLVRVLVSILRGVDGREVFLQVTETHLQWRYTDGMWDNLIALADLKGDKGETPVLRTNSNGIEWKYESEEEDAWKELVSYETLKLKFTDLTSEQIDAFWRSIPKDIQLLFQKPAQDAADKVIKEVNEVKANLTADVEALEERAETVIRETSESKALVDKVTKIAQSVSDHPGYIGSDYYVYVWDYISGSYNKTDTVLRPEGFSIYRTYPSVETMEADLTDVPEGKFVLINTNDVEVPDNAKLYVRGATSFEYLVDMSGAIGFTGKTPQITIGNVTVGSSASATLSPDGFDEDGNPRYKLNLVVVPGPRGGIPLIETGTVTTGEAGGEATVDLLPNGQTEDGRDKYLLNFVIPQGLPGEGFGNLAVDPSGLLTGKKYLLMFSRDGMPESGTLIEYVAPIIPKKTSDLENDCDFIDTTGVAQRIGTHDGDPGAHGDIRQRITDVEAIARGKSRAKIFNTVDELDEWLSKEENTLLLQKGDNFYIRDKGVPDYWWDGTAKQELEVEKVDLSVFYDKGTSDKRFSFKPLQKTAVLLPGSWIEDEEEGLWWQEVEDGDVREGCFLEAWPVDKKSADEAINIHIYENMPVTDGRFRVAAEKKASEAINITYTIIK